METLQTVLREMQVEHHLLAEEQATRSWRNSWTSSACPAGRPCLTNNSSSARKQRVPSS